MIGRHINRQTGIQTRREGQRHRHTAGRQAYRQTDMHTDTQRGAETHAHSW